MGLEDHDQSSGPGKSQAGLDNSGDLARIVCVVVDDPNASHFALGLEPPARTGEASESLQNSARILPEPFRGGRERGSRIKEVVATCLLYTSPSPRDRTRYRMPSSA